MNVTRFFQILKDDMDYRYSHFKQYYSEFNDNHFSFQLMEFDSLKTGEITISKINEEETNLKFVISHNDVTYTHIFVLDKSGKIINIS